MEVSHDNIQVKETHEDLLLSHFPLHRACRDGDIETMSLLLSSDTNLYQEDGLYGWTPIHWAAHYGKLSCLMKLLDHGCNCDYPVERFNHTPLHLAADGGQGHCVKWLLHCGATINRQLACLRKLVIECGVDLDIATSKFSQTALHLSAQAGQANCIQWLIPSGANILTQDYMGETPLHKAARTGNMECVSLLISQGSKLLIRNHNGQSPSQVAAECGFHECAAYIERAAQIEQTQEVSHHHSTSPSTDLRQNGCVLNGNAMEEDDMDTDLTTLPKGYRANPLAGIKRCRDENEEDERKKSRRDEPAHWTNGNGCHGNITHYGDHCQLGYKNGFTPNHTHTIDPQLHHNGLTCHEKMEKTNGFHLYPTKFGDIMKNNNSIQESTSIEEHYSSLSQEQGYDSLLMASFGNQYDGS